MRLRPSVSLPALSATLNRRCGVAAALLGLTSLSVAFVAQAAPSGNSGGNWYGAGESCSTADNLNSYGGACALAAGDNASDANMVIVDDTPNARVYGGYVTNDAPVEASRNVITVQGGAAGSVIGGRALAAGDGGFANDNQIIVEDGNLGSIIGGQSSRGAHRNQVVVTGGTIQTIDGAQSVSGSLTHNRVTITGNTTLVSSLVAAAWVSGHGNVSNNEVQLRGGLTNNTVFGGFVAYGNASENRVSISDTAQLGWYVYGGHVSTEGDATNNRVIISGSPGLANSIIYGGYTRNGLSTGNILEVHTSQLTIGNLKDFQELHFILPSNVVAGETVLTLNGKAVPSRQDQNPAPVATDLRGVKVGVAIQGGGQALKEGDRLTLIQNPIGLLTDATVSTVDVSGYQGVSLGYQFSLSTDANHLFATTQAGNGAAGQVLEQTKAPVEGQAAALGLMTQGSDLVATAGLAQALAASNGSSEVSTFGVTSGGRSRYKSGSYVDVNGVNLMLGAAKRIDRQAGSLLTALFIEGGWGRNDTHNNFSTGWVRGDGKSHYLGGGVLLRQEWAQDQHGKRYAEGSLRLGRVSSDWHSQNMLGSANASYDTASIYYGAHLGLGQVWSWNEHYSVDVSAKYFWTHQNRVSVTIAQDPYTFKAIDSHRTLLGARLNRLMPDQGTAYVGAYWQREFNGQARATVYGLDIAAPSLKGNTGVVEVGFDWRPGAKQGLTVGIGAQAYVGMRQGVSGNARLQWAF